MNKTKLLTTVVLAGFTLQQPVFSQPAGSLAATNSEVYGAMVSNVVRLSTEGSEPATTAVSNPPSGTIVTTPTATVIVSSVITPVIPVTNVTVTPVGSNSHSGMIVTTTISSEATVPVTSVSNMAIAPAGSNHAVGVEMTNVTPPAEADTNVVADATADTNAVPENPTIQFQEIPITAAIASLARQAGINYLMDPKIGYGLPDANNVVKAEPSLSIRWENITPEQALIALLDNYGLQLVTDPKTKISKVTIKDPTAPPPLTTVVYQLAYANVGKTEAIVTTVLTDKRSKVVSDVRTSQLIVQATDKEQTDVASLIKKVDQPTRQVLIETRFIEISSNPETRKGVDWSGTLQQQNFSAGNGSYSRVVSDLTTTGTQIPGVSTTVTTPSGNTIVNTPASSTTANNNNIVNTVMTSGPGIALNTANGLTPGIGFLSADGLKATLSFLNQSADAQVVSTPRIVTLDNEEATIAVTRAFPIFATTAGTQGSPGGSSVTYSNVGIVLKVTPHISANDYVWMKVLPSISSFFAEVTKTVGGFINQADEFDSRTIDTQVLIPNANTLVMGGMVKDSPNARYTKVPLLGDIPVLGWAFRSEVKTMDKQNLLIFITPTIIKDSDFQPTVTRFMESRPIMEKEPLDPNSAWESGKPHNWSDPKNTDPTQIIINQKTTE